MTLTRLAFASFIAFAISATTLAAEDVAEIIVTGEGRAASAPDTATVSLGVRREAREARAAMTAASEAAAGVLATLEAAGVAPEDVQTTRIGLDPSYARSNDSGPPRITGYIASNDLSVRVRDLDSLGQVLDAVIGEGANNFGGLTFGLSDTGALSREARTAAVADARSRAETLAEAAGVSLGSVKSIGEAGTGPGPQPLMRGAMVAESAAMVPVAEGEIEVTVSVTMVFEIED